MGFENLKIELLEYNIMICYEKKKEEKMGVVLGGK